MSHEALHALNDKLRKSVAAVQSTQPLEEAARSTVQAVRTELGPRSPVKVEMAVRSEPGRVRLSVRTFPGARAAVDQLVQRHLAAARPQITATYSKIIKGVLR